MEVSDLYFDSVQVFGPTLKKESSIVWSLINISFPFVVWGGIEPPTQGFSVLCSTN
jgi:hypothetical protein